MAQITYFLGAGASYGALPIVSDMYTRMGETIKWFTPNGREALKVLNAFGDVVNIENSDRLNKIIDDLKWLRNICNTERNFSVDTYARKLNLAEKEDEYIKLRNILSFYFTLEQKRNLPDVRYDNFWASILKERQTFPDNIRIVSWNYDSQLELTYQDFLDHNSLKVARETLNIISPEIDMVDLPDPGRFGIFKLNGSATFNINNILDRDLKYLVDDFKKPIHEFIIELIGIYETICDKPKIYKNHLSFAWEHQKNSPFFMQLKEAVSDTEILVVIGYSFPFFNRDTDKIILNDFMGKTLRKVYFQAPDAEDLRERFLAINDNVDLNLVLRKDIKQFTLPNEL